MHTPCSRWALLWALCPDPFPASEVKSTSLKPALKQHGTALASSLSHILALFHFPKSKWYPTLGNRAAKAQGGLPDPIHLFPFLMFLTLWFWFGDYDCCPTLGLPVRKGMSVGCPAHAFPTPLHLLSLIHLLIPSFLPLILEMGQRVHVRGLIHALMALVINQPWAADCCWSLQTKALVGIFPSFMLWGSLAKFFLNVAIDDGSSVMVEKHLLYHQKPAPCQNGIPLSMTSLCAGHRSP